MQSRAVLIAIVMFLSTLACHTYRRDCSSPLRRTAWVEPQLVQMAEKAALEWYDKTDGWEIIDIKSPIPRDRPLPGDIHILLKEIIGQPPSTAGVYFSHNSTIFIEPAYKNDINVMMHELGHAMGSPHLGPPGTIMHPNVIGNILDKESCKHMCCKPKK